MSIERKGSGSLIVNAGATVAGTMAGVVYYTLASGSDATADSYVAVFHTSDATMDSQDVPALWCVGTNNVPADAKAVNAVSTSPVTTLSAFLGSTGAAVNGTTANTLASHDPGATIGTSTYAGADTSGTTTLLARIPGTVQPQTGDAYAYLGTNLGALGANATALAPASTALSTANWTTARAAKLDNLDVASSTLATAASLSTLQTAVNNLNNLSALANLFGPATLVRPSTGSIVYPLTFVVRDSEGHAIDVDTNTVTLTASNAAGTDRSANLSAVTHSGTGEYTFTYTVASAHADEGLRITAAGTVQSATRKAYLNTDVADADSLAALAAIQLQTDKLTFAGSNLQVDLQTIKGQTVTAAAGVTFPASVGTSTYAGADTSGTTTLLTRVTGAVPLAADYSTARAAKLDNLDVAVSTRMATFTVPANFGTLSLTNGQTVGTSTYAGGAVASVTGAVASVTAPVTLTSAYDAAKSAAQAGDAMALTSGERSTLSAALLDLANGVETSVTVRQALRLMAAMLGGQISGADTTNPVVKAAGNPGTTRLGATTDASGNRSSVTLSL